MDFTPPIAVVSRRRFLAEAATLSGGYLIATHTAIAAGTDALERYASDYISFVGSNERAHVFLAHDNNRGQTGTRFLADHWIAMFDKATRWVDVEGSSHYPNREKRLDLIPSEHFVFEGTAATGLSFKSASNDMALAIGQLPPILRRSKNDGAFWTGAAPARSTGGVAASRDA